MLEIKLTTTATATATATYYYYYYYHYFYHCNYYVYDKGCWHMYIDTTPFSVPSKASSSSCLLAEEQALPHLIGLNWFAILHKFVQFGSLLR